MRKFYQIWFVAVPFVLLVGYISLCLNRNLADTLGGLSEVLSFATFILLYFSVLYAAKTLKEQVNTRDEERRPYVILFIVKGEDGRHQAVLKNIGRLPASAVSVTTTPKMSGRFSMLLCGCLTVLNDTILFIPPGAELKFSIEGPDANSQINSTESFRVEIRYRCEVLNRQYSDTYAIGWPDQFPQELRDLCDSTRKTRNPNSESET